MQQYNIVSHRSNCFYHTADHENNFLKFEWQGEEYNCLQHFVPKHEDYVMGEGDDHYNFSIKGQYNMASILLQGGLKKYMDKLLANGCGPYGRFQKQIQVYVKYLQMNYK